MFEKFTDTATRWVGSTLSIMLHTLFFIGVFGLLLFGVELNTILLVLTTAVSLEAIYLALFIQRSVNQNTATLEEVGEDIEGISEDVEDLGEDLEGLEKDIDEIGEDVEELGEDLDEVGKDLEGLEKDLKEIGDDLDEVSEDVDEVGKDLDQISERDQRQFVVETTTRLEREVLEVKQLLAQIANKLHNEHQ